VQEPANRAPHFTWIWPVLAAALCATAGASWALSRRPVPSLVVADGSRTAWEKSERASVQPAPAPAENSRCNEPTEPDQTVKQDPPVVAPAARVHSDPLTGDTAKRVAATKGCTCAALDPACACLPLASPCPVPGAGSDGPCRYF
jgi:hypothetical protein